MGEIFIPAKFPEGDPVTDGRISLDISPKAIDAIIKRRVAYVHNPKFGHYFKLRLLEHQVAYEVISIGKSVQLDKELKSIRAGIAKSEEDNPAFQKDLTDHLNFIINKHR